MKARDYQILQNLKKLKSRIAKRIEKITRQVNYLEQDNCTYSDEIYTPSKNVILGNLCILRNPWNPF